MNFLKRLLHKKNDWYVSEIDHFLMEFDATYPARSPSQQEEAETYNKIIYLRDKRNKNS